MGGFRIALTAVTTRPKLSAAAHQIRIYPSGRTLIGLAPVIWTKPAQFNPIASVLFVAAYCQRCRRNNQLISQN